MRARMS